MININSVAKASIILLVGTIVSKVLGFARELLVAYKFGAGIISDAFVLTNGIPSIIFVSLATAIRINYIPFYHRIETENARNRFTSNLLNLSLLVLLVGCIVVNFFPGLVLKIFATGLPHETENYAVTMLRIVVFSIVPIILAYLFQAYLQANGMFASTALYGVVANIVVIVATFFATQETFYFLSIGTVMSHVAGLLLILYFVRKSTSFHYECYINPKDPLIKGLVFLTLPLMLEDFASSMSLLVGRNLASFLDKGTISGLSYAGTIGNIASTMIATAIITATFPLFSQLIANDQKDDFIIQFKKYSYVISYLLAPLSVFMIFNAHDIVVFIFKHGAFDQHATKIVMESMICYVVGVLPMGLQTYLIRGFYAMQDTRTPVKVKVFSLFCNIVLSFLTVRFFAHKGIAISTSISYVIAYGLLLYAMKRKHGIKELGSITREGILAVLFSLAPAFFCCLVFNSALLISNVLVRLIAEGLLFTVLFCITMAVFRKEQFCDILRVIWKR